MRYDFIIVYISGYQYGYGHEKRVSLLNSFLKKKNNKTKILNISNFDKTLATLNKLSKSSNKLIFDITNKNFLKKNKKILFFIKDNLIGKKYYVFDSFDIHSINKFYKKSNNISYIIPYVYKSSQKKNYFQGLKYFLVPNTTRYIKKHINKSVYKVMISFGGSDLGNLSLKIIQKLEKFEFKKLDIKILIGKYSNFTAYEKNLESKHNITFIKTENIFRYFFWSDISFISSGLSKYEAIYTRTPSVVVETQNEDLYLNKYLKELHLNYFIKEKSLLNNFDDYFKKITSYDSRQDIFKKCNKIIDNNGFERIYRLLK